MEVRKSNEDASLALHPGPLSESQLPSQLLARTHPDGISFRSSPRRPHSFPVSEPPAAVKPMISKTASWLGM